MTLTIHHGDNLDTLRRLASAGVRFDLVELDGPYGAGLEGWDCLSEAEYVAHYAERLTLVRQVLQPWGVTFLFGYPEMVAEVKVWARTTGALEFRRWVTWYVNSTAHAGRRTQTIGVFILPTAARMLEEFTVWLKARRTALGLSLREARRLTGVRVDMLDNPRASSGGYFWYETIGSGIPSRRDYESIKRVFDAPERFDALPDLANLTLDGVTGIDFISVPVERAAELNDAGLRSKPVGLYDTLFRPVVPPRDTKRALILYGGSGNAAIAAGRLGYDVDICETEESRCALIRRRYAWGVERRDETPVEELGPLFAGVGL